ncbi:DUF6221 family protein [Nocardia brasiliensis]|uniref:DUF6221 family protein n=1 Tax=Nocardia brasiliensis TaxID=37326 RepID=UPI0036710FE7
MKALVHFIRARILDDETGAGVDRGGQGAWSAQRILDECAAKRAVLAALERDRKEKAAEDAWDWLDEGSAIAWLFGDSNEEKSKKLAREILRALALPYADHPDYQSDWFVDQRRARKFW